MRGYIKKLIGIMLILNMFIILGACQPLAVETSTIQDDCEKDIPKDVPKDITSGANNKSADNIMDSTSLALYNCTIIDGTGAEAMKDKVILISDGVIEQIGDNDSLQIPEGYKKIDLSNKVVLPGFINTHVHSGWVEENLVRWLQAGVTTVRDVGRMPDVDGIALRDEFNKRGDVARLLVSTPILSVPDGYGTEYFNSADEVQKIINNYISRDVDFVKFSIEDFQAGRSWKMASDEEYAAIVEAAHAGGKKAIVHVDHARFLDFAVEIGVDQILHMATEKISEESCNAIVEKGIWWVPTLELWKGVSRKHNVNYLKTAQDNLSMFYNAGGKIAFGTDFDGYVTKFDTGFPITEVILMKEAGMSNMDIIKAGTYNAAQACDLGDQLGTIEKGKMADILVVEGNPLENIEDLQNTYMVIYNGVIVNKQ